MICRDHGHACPNIRTLASEPLSAIRDVGHRIASRVRVKGGAFTGWVGLVYDLTNAPDSIMVRFVGGLVLPFGRSELEVV